MRLGNKNVWLTWVVTMLMLSDVALMITSIIDYNMWALKSVTLKGIVIQGIAWAVSDGMFSVSHFLLAMKYQTMTRRIPTKLDGKP